MEKGRSQKIKVQEAGDSDLPSPPTSTYSLMITSYLSNTEGHFNQYYVYCIRMDAKKQGNPYK